MKEIYNNHNTDNFTLKLLAYINKNLNKYIIFAAIPLIAVILLYFSDSFSNNLYIILFSFYTLYFILLFFIFVKYLLKYVNINFFEKVIYIFFAKYEIYKRYTIFALFSISMTAVAALAEYNYIKGAYITLLCGFFILFLLSIYNKLNYKNKHEKVENAVNYILSSANQDVMINLKWRPKVESIDFISLIIFILGIIFFKHYESILNVFLDIYAIFMVVIYIALFILLLLIIFFYNLIVDKNICKR